ncbi:MAG: hypothetical protein P8X74_05490 [Reinekea sp.]
MNIAFPAVVIFLILLPGAIFRTTFNISEDKSYFGQMPLSKAATVSFIYAIFLHLLWLIITIYIFKIKIDFYTLFVLLTSYQGRMDAALVAVSSSIYKVFTYFITLILFSGILGISLRYLVNKFKLDHGDSWLAKVCRVNTPWYYYFTDHYSDHKEEPVYIIVSALVDVAGSGVIYEGFLKKWYTDRDGKLDRIVIEEAVRWPLDLRSDTPISKAKTDTFDIFGHNLTLKMSEVQNLNIQYYYFDECTGQA